MAVNRKRGRPATFQPDDRTYLAELIRQHGIRGTKRMAGLAVSTATLLKIARDFGIVLRRGRRPKLRV